MIHKFEIDDHIYQELLKMSEDKSIKMNERLAGNIRQEYSLEKYIDIVEPFILSKFNNITNLTDYFYKKLKVVYPNPQPLVLDSLWVNRQKKHEFNPFHRHDGLFSFILFIKIPFKKEEEWVKAPGVLSNLNVAGMLSFFVLDSDSQGGIREIQVPVDKEWERTGLIFKANVNHCVYPFYSDGERITISGNLSLSNKQRDII